MSAQINIIMDVQLVALPIDQIKTLIAEAVKDALRELKPEPYAEYPELLSRKQVCKILNICLASIDNYARKGLLTKHRINGSIRFKKSEVLNAMKTL